MKLRLFFLLIAAAAFAFSTACGSSSHPVTVDCVAHRYGWRGWHRQLHRHRFKRHARCHLDAVLYHVQQSDSAVWNP